MKAKWQMGLAYSFPIMLTQLVRQMLAKMPLASEITSFSYET